MKIIHCSPFNMFSKIGASLYSNPMKITHGLIEAGHYVQNFDYREYSRYFSTFKSKRFGRKKMNQHLLKLVQEIKPDLIIFGHAELIDIDTFHEIKKHNLKMIFWFNDMYVDTLFQKIGYLFDAAFVTGAGKILEEYKKYNVNSFFLPNPIHKNMEQHRGYEVQHHRDILIPGRALKERMDLIKFLKSHDQLSIKSIGCTKKSVVLGEDYFDLIVTSRIVLNHNRSSYISDNDWYTSDRLMHILGNGTFCLSRPIKGGENFFEDKLVYYENKNDLLDKIYYYLENVEQRTEKSKWLQERVHNLFNAKRVAEYMIDVLDEKTIKLKKYEWWND